MELSDVKKKFFEYIDKVISNNKISHAYLIELNNYDQDLKYIYDFIKMILCNISYEELQKADNSIISLVDSHNYPDLFEISPDGTFVKKEQLLQLQQEFRNKSLLDNKKIYIIRQAECLNSSSANTILKFLEEPEENIIAILLTDNRYHVIDTIRSRCQILTLKETVKYDYEIGDITFLKYILFPNEFFLNYNSKINEEITDKKIMKNKLLLVEAMIIDYLNYKYDVNKDISEDLLNVCKNKTSEDLLNTISILEREIKKLEFNINFKIWIDSFLAQLLNGV